jgi:hypothetical protein
VRVFKILDKDDPDQDAPQTGLRALINGQSHAKRDTQFFKTNAVNLEHIAGSMLVTLDCTSLNQTSRNAMFMANRETFREDDVQKDLFKKLQKELKSHEGLQALNKKRYEEKIANATSDELGISALEELLATDPTLADLFSSMMPGKVAAATKKLNPGDKVVGDPKADFVGKEFPTYFKRADGMTVVKIALPQDDDARTSFNTDVTNNYFTRPKHAGKVKFVGQLEPTFHLFNGRLTFTFHAPKKAVVGTALMTQIEISDDAGHGPFKLVVTATIVPPREKAEPKPPKEPKQAQDSPSRPDVIEVVAADHREGTEHQPASARDQQGLEALGTGQESQKAGRSSSGGVCIQVRPGADRHGFAGERQAYRRVEEQRGAVPQEYSRSLRGRGARYRAALSDLAAETAEGGLTVVFR